MKLLLVSILVFSVSAFTQEESSREPAPVLLSLRLSKSRPTI